MPRRTAPSYDAAKQDYTGISAGALHDTDDLRAARAFAEMIVDTVREGLLVLDFDLRVEAANESFYRLFGVPPEQTLGRRVYELGNGQWDLPELRTLLEEILPKNEAFDDYEVDHAFEGGGRRVMRLNARRLDDHELILLAIEDVTERRAGEQALRQSEAAFRHLADAVPHLVWTAHADGTVDYYNSQAARYDGIRRGDERSWDWAPALHPDDVERTTEAWQRAVETEELYEVEHRVRMADGAYRWHVSRARPVRNAPGEAVRWYGTATDIHRLKEAERALRESEERYRTLFTSMDQGYCVLEMILDEEDWPVDYRFVEANPAFEGQTGLVDAVGRTARELVPDLEDRWVEIYGRVAATGEPARFEQGSEAMGRWFDVYASRVGGPESRRVALLFTDITERKRAEEARRESEQRYRTLFRQAPAFIAMLRGPEHRFEFVNPAYLRLVGERDLVGKPVREALPEVEGQGLFEMLDRVYNEGETFTAVDRPLVVQRSEGTAAERRFVDFVYQPLREPDGSVSGVIALGIDTTDRVQAQHEVDRTNRELEQRVRVRTQQVRQLSRALTLAEQKERQRIAHVLHDDLQQLLFGAQMASSLGDADRLDAVLTEAMTLTRSLSHEMSPPLLQGEDLEDLLRWLAEQKRKQYEMEVLVEVRGGVSVPESDLRVLLYQIVRELLFNVAKHAGTKWARIVAERTDGHLRVVVADEGTGFDLAELEGDGAAGLGLPSVRERLELVGGELAIESVPGQGTRVTITVPIDEGPIDE